MYTLTKTIFLLQLASANQDFVPYSVITNTNQCINECISEPENVYCFYGNNIGGFCCHSDTDAHCSHGLYCTSGLTDPKLKTWMCAGYPISTSELIEVGGKPI